MPANPATIQSVRYPGLQPPSTAAQALHGAISGASGFLTGRNTAQQTQAQQQATGRNAVLGPLINQGQLGVAPQGQGFSPFQGSPFNLQQQTPTGDVLDPLQQSRKRQIDLKIGDVFSPAFTTKDIENDVGDSLARDYRFQRLINNGDLAEARRMFEGMVSVRRGDIKAAPPDAKPRTAEQKKKEDDEAWNAQLEKIKGVGKKAADFFKKIPGTVGDFFNPASQQAPVPANIQETFNPQRSLNKPEFVAQTDWDNASDSEKRTLLDAYGL